MSTQPATVEGAVVTGSTEPGTTVSTSELQGPGAGPAEAVEHITSSIKIDEFLHSEFIAGPTIPINTTMLPGTRLYTAKVHPHNVNELTTYYSRMYNGWTGGIDVRIVIAATGFHAGKIGVARLPPNYKPEDISRIADLTVFNYRFFDVKLTNELTVHIPDQRRVMYHYMKPVDGDLTEDEFGGWFIIWVMLPLKTSSTGNASVDMQLFFRMGADMDFEQPVPLISPMARLAASPYQALFPTIVENGLERAAVQMGMYLNTEVEYLYAALPEPAVTYGKWGIRKLDGEPYYAPYKSHGGLVFNYYQEAGTGRFTEVDALGNFMPVNRPVNTVCKWISVYFEGSSSSVVTGDYSMVGANWVLDPAKFGPIRSGATAAPWNGFRVMAGRCEGSRGGTVNTYGNFLLSGADYEKDNSTPITPPEVYNGESVVYFEERLNVQRGSSPPFTARWCQTHYMQQIIQTLAKEFNGDLTTCYLFIAYEKGTGLPVFYLKLYPEGFFTTSPVTQATIFKFTNYKYLFSGLTTKTSFIPTTSEMKRNLILFKATGCL